MAHMQGQLSAFPHREVILADPHPDSRSRPVTALRRFLGRWDVDAASTCADACPWDATRGRQ